DAQVARGLGQRDRAVDVDVDVTGAEQVAQPQHADSRSGGAGCAIHRVVGRTLHVLDDDVAGGVAGDQTGDGAVAGAVEVTEVVDAVARRNGEAAEGGEIGARGRAVGTEEADEILVFDARRVRRGRLVQRGDADAARAARTG